MENLGAIPQKTAENGSQSSAETLYKLVETLTSNGHTVRFARRRADLYTAVIGNYYADRSLSLSAPTLDELIAVVRDTCTRWIGDFVRVTDSPAPPANAKPQREVRYVDIDADDDPRIWARRQTPDKYRFDGD
jgi:hypothetical protein